jgi:hypothetical protein
MRVRHFIRHYLEMLVAMFLGMGVLGVPAVLALESVGVTYSELQDDAPALLIVGMAATMTVPMVGWMRYRGHGWPACADMTAAMLVPTAGILALLWSGVMTDVGMLLMIEHTVMPPLMLVAMLLRRDEYTGAAHHRALA